MEHLKIISAGAGSGKTYRLTKEMTQMLRPNEAGVATVRASGIIATTYTNKAAAELKERVRVELLESGLTKEADELGNAMIGTVHSIGVQLLKRFAFEAGVSPEISIIADSDQQIFFNQAIATVLKVDLIEEMGSLTDVLGFDSSPYTRTDWRKDLKKITDIARANNFDVEVLKESKAYSIQSYFELLPPVSDKGAAYFDERLLQLMQQTLDQLLQNEDATKAKETMVSKLKTAALKMKNQGHLPWRDWVSICKLKASKKKQEMI
jgi:ATP-dependent exoDNAse (exonuclease V) beta subunit